MLICIFKFACADLHMQMSPVTPVQFVCIGIASYYKLCRSVIQNLRLEFYRLVLATFTAFFISVS